METEDNSYINLIKDKQEFFKVGEDYDVIAQGW